MPRRDGTGPMGDGPMSGRGLGPCTGTRPTRHSVGFGMGLGRRLLRRRGFARNYGRGLAINRNAARAQR